MSNVQIRVHMEDVWKRIKELEQSLEGEACRSAVGGPEVCDPYIFRNINYRYLARTEYWVY